MFVLLNCLRTPLRSFALPSSVSPLFRSRLPHSRPFSTTLVKLDGMASVFSSSRLHDKVVLITGAGDGIGKATALLFAKAGANVILTARNQEKLNKAVAEAEQANKQGGSGHGGKCVGVTLDVQDRKAVDSLLDRVPEGLRQVDVLVNNAGLVFGVEKVGDINPDEIDTMYQTNVLGLIRLTQLFVREFKKRNSGHIIQLGSVAGREAYPGGSIYCSTKAALRAFTSAMMKELVNTKIRVTEVQPGMVETNFSVTRFRGDKATADKVYEGIEPLTGDDIAEEIVWAASRPAHVNIAETFVLPVNQASPYHVHRDTK